LSLGAATATGWISTQGDPAQWLADGGPITPAQLVRVLRRPGVVPLLGTVGLGFAVTGLMDVLLVALALAVLTVVLVIVVGASRGCFDVAARTLTLRSLPDEWLAAVFSLQESMLMLGLCVGSALAPLLTRQFGNHNAFAAAGVGFAIVLSLIATKLIPLDRRTQLPEAELELLTRVPLFSEASGSSRRAVGQVRRGRRRGRRQLGPNSRPGRVVC